MNKEGQIIKLIAICLFLVLTSFVYAQNESIMLESTQASEIVIVHKDGSINRYASTSDTDVARGMVLLAVMGIVADGDTLYLSSNTFDIQDNQIDLSIGNTGTVHLHGAGKYTTIIKSSKKLWPDGRVIIHPGNKSIVQDLSIVGALTGKNYQACWGASFYDGAFINAELRNIYCFAGTDGLYVYTYAGLCSANIYNVTVDTHYDSLAISSEVIFNIYDSIFNAIYLKGVSTTGRAVINNDPTAVINLFNCKLSVTGFTSINYGVFSNGSVGKITLFGGIITTSGFGIVYDLIRDVGTLTVTAGTIYDRTKTFGTIICANSCIFK